jgi:hypothetical protein
MSTLSDCLPELSRPITVVCGLIKTELNRKRDAMTESPKNRETETELKCPDCRYPLKRRRGRQTDECEMLCGGCGRVFDVCDLDTLEEIKKQS